MVMRKQRFWRRHGRRHSSARTRPKQSRSWQAPSGPGSTTAISAAVAASSMLHFGATPLVEDMRRHRTAMARKRRHSASTGKGKQMKSFGRCLMSVLAVAALLAASTLPASALSQVTTTTENSADLAIGGSPQGTPVRWCATCARSFNFTVTNEGPDAANNVVATFNNGNDILVGVLTTSSGLSCAESTSLVTCVKPWLGKGQSINVEVTARQGGCLCSRFGETVFGSVTSNTSDPNTTNNTARAWYEVIL
jgi:Domain of unknown function DUF11